MLKIILDTNLFRNSNLQSLEDYRFSRLFEKLYKLIYEQKIQDVRLVVNEMVLFEYIEQVADWYQHEIIEGYEKIFNAIQNRYPAQKMYFQSREDFIEDYKYGMFESLSDRKINTVKTLPQSQTGGISIIDIVEKTIKNIAPFDKKHNRDLKDAFISETINTQAKNNNFDTYVLITQNEDDFKDNQLLTGNYKIEFVKQRNSLIQVFDIIKKYGSKIEDDVYYRELLKNDRFSSDIKDFIEKTILDAEYYDFVPVAKRYGEEYYIDYSLGENNTIKVRFYLLDDTNEYECGIIYDLSNKKPKKISRYITILDESGEEVELNDV